jgi:phytoene dehydrogenase-like protein
MLRLPGTETYDAVVVGGGHNGLVAAAYLARAGRRTLLLERQPITGGAAISAHAFPGVDARVSRYSYLVSLLPDQIVHDLGLRLELRSRPIASYTPVRRGNRDTGLLVERREGPATAASFREITGSERDYVAWQKFYAEVAELAADVAPTLLQPLPHADELAASTSRIWTELVEQPLGVALEDRFTDDTVRGVVLTDALIGTFAGAHDDSLGQNRCFLYHLIGNRTGEWRVPVGGMGAVTDELARAALAAGVEIRTGVEVTGVESDGEQAEVHWQDGEEERSVAAPWVLAGVAPAVLDRLVGRREAVPRPEGAQLKINLLLSRLPRLRSGVDPRIAFSGTFHVAEGYAQLQQAYDEAAAGSLPSTPPGELYCHSLTDASILGAELAGRGFHTLTYFGVHMPARLFAHDHDARKQAAVDQALRAVDAYLVEPLAQCLARDDRGQLCIEAATPVELERTLAMPGGHIFHGDLAWPWRIDSSRASSPAEAWGVSTDVPNVVLCGSGAVRGGAVSGIGGHNAAMAVLQTVSV